MRRIDRQRDRQGQTMRAAQECNAATDVIIVVVALIATGPDRKASATTQRILAVSFVNEPYYIFSRHMLTVFGLLHCTALFVGRNFIK